MLIETLNSIIGERADSVLTEKLKAKISNHKEVLGVYDLTLHNYGPNQIIGTAHIELKDDTTAKQIHLLTRKITAEIFTEFGIIVTLGIYASNDSSENALKIKEDVKKIVSSRPEILQMHGFYIDEESKCVMFDLIVDFKADAQAVQKEVCEKISSLYPEYRFDVILDTDYSD